LVYQSVETGACDKLDFIHVGVISCSTMTAPTHVISGLAVVVAVGRLAGMTPDAVGLLAVIFGSLAPDIDGTGVITRPGTILRRLLGRGLANLLDMIAEFVAAVVRLFFRHRGFIHAPLLAVCLLAAGVLLAQGCLIWFGVGYAVHLLGDAMTRGGIPMWSPFSTRRVSLSSMRTGSRGELVVASVLLVFTCLCGWTLLPETVKESHRHLYNEIVKAGVSQDRPRV
jgi:membrane-bound metal-dependent hydrolase YbcI (DUF457 family)